MAPLSHPGPMRLERSGWGCIELCVIDLLTLVNGIMIRRPLYEGFRLPCVCSTVVCVVEDEAMVSERLVLHALSAPGGRRHRRQRTAKEHLGVLAVLGSDRLLVVCL